MDVVNLLQDAWWFSSQGNLSYAYSMQLAVVASESPGQDTKLPVVTTELPEQDASESPALDTELPVVTTELPGDVTELPEQDASESPALYSELPVDTTELPGVATELPEQPAASHNSAVVNVLLSHVGQLARVLFEQPEYPLFKV